ncbi:MAG: hypothetical protein KJN60_00465, partial [Boseongicola sp.]|nr:hypothetical protein [Boseongicola sp.]
MAVKTDAATKQSDHGRVEPESQALDLYLSPVGFALVFGSLLAVAFLAQLALFRLGVYSTAADESARTLIASQLSWNNALDTFVWPPLYKIVFGLGLEVHRDLFLTPRIMSQVFGVLTCCALAWYGYSLFRSRAVALVSIALSIFLNHRLLFSVAPMSETIYNPIILLAFASFVQLLRSFRAFDVHLTAVFLALASMVRYEAWFASLLFGIFLVWMCFVRRRVLLRSVVIAGLIVSIFPSVWLTIAHFGEGGVRSIFVASMQPTALGVSTSQMLLWSHAFRFMRDVLETALIVGLIPLMLIGGRDGVVRG